MSADGGCPLLAGLASARRRIGAVAVRHTAFGSALRELRHAARCPRLILLLGVAGVGKGMLARTFAEECRAHPDVAPEHIAAIQITAPSPQRGATFSWKTLWGRALLELEAPLAHHAVDAHATATRLRAGANPVPRDPTLDRVRHAAHERRLRLLVIDEGMALFETERGRTVLSQLKVLRELSDAVDFPVVLLSTLGVVPRLEYSTPLARRLRIVVFPPYLGARSERPGDIKLFRRVAREFLRELPAAARPRLSRAQLDLLHTGSVGRVGILCDWIRAALALCISEGATQLGWEHFEATALPRARRTDMREETRRGEEYAREVLDRAFLPDEQEEAEACCARSRGTSARCSPRPTSIARSTRGGFRPSCGSPLRTRGPLRACARCASGRPSRAPRSRLACAAARPALSLVLGARRLRDPRSGLHG